MQHPAASLSALGVGWMLPFVLIFRGQRHCQATLRHRSAIAPGNNPTSLASSRLFFHAQCVVVDANHAAARVRLTWWR